MRPTRTFAVRATTAIASLTLVAGAVAAVAETRDSSGRGTAEVCSHRLAGAHLSRSDHRGCVIAVASAYLAARTGEVAPSMVPLDPKVSAYNLSEAPRHTAGGGAKVRAALAKDTTKRIGKEQWVVDGNVAMVSYAGWRGKAAGTPSYYVAQRFTIRNGLIWEVLSSKDAAVSSGGGGFPNTPVSVVTGPPAPMSATPDYDDAAWCTVRIGEKGDRSLTYDQHRRCLIAIATTYVDAEENSIPGNQILFDPRFSRYSLGGEPTHNPANSDLIRTQEGTYQGTYNRVIRSIHDREWTVDGDRVWIVYQGDLVISTTHPGFYVAERFTIRRGLIWQIMIAPIGIKVP
jgi:hypothetical protein